MDLSVYLGRMPIMNEQGDIFAYELLHRCSDENRTTIDDNVQATARVLVNDLIFCISPEYFILEILEESLISTQLIERIQTLHAKGYTFALNHYKSDESFLELFKPIIPFARYIKIDIRRDTREKIINMLERIRHQEIICIAEKVEDDEDYEWAKEAGFEYFEGYYFSKPQIYIRERIDPDSKTLLKLIYFLKKDAPIEEVIHIINTSPYLSVNMLKFIHLHHQSAHKRISSIDQAIVLLGRQRLTYWVELMTYAQGDTPYDGDNISSPLGKIARSRAYLMEELSPLVQGAKLQDNHADSAYLVGILSLGEAIFLSSFKDLFTQMDLDENIAKALEFKEGTLGELLKLCIAVERNSFDEIALFLSHLGISQNALNGAMMRAYQRSCTY